MNETIKSDTNRKTAATKIAKTHAKTYEVEIAGVPLRLKSSHDEQTVKELVRLVDEKVREALPLTKTGSIQNASILASLNLAEDYLMLKRKALTELDGLEAKAMKVITEMESSRSHVAPKTASNSTEN